jgi:hypothetical protein
MAPLDLEESKESLDLLEILAHKENPESLVPPDKMVCLV